MLKGIPFGPRWFNFPGSMNGRALREHVGMSVMVDRFTKSDSSSRDAGSKSVDIHEEPFVPNLLRQMRKSLKATFYLLGFNSFLQSIQLSSLKDLDLNWNVARWREFLGFPDEDDFLSRIRGNTFSGKPLFAEELVADLEKELGVSLGRKPRGDLGRKSLKSVLRCYVYKFLRREKDVL